MNDKQQGWGWGVAVVALAALAACGEGPPPTSTLGRAIGEACGDGLCHLQETFASCPADCAADVDGDGLDEGVDPDPRRADADHDGLPDGVELSWGLDPLDAVDAGGDLDGDGASNLAEYLAGSDALSAASAPTSAGPVTMSPTDAHPTIALTPDRLGVGYTDWPTRGVRSTVGIQPGSGFFYFEAHRNYDPQDYGVGVVSATHPLDQYGGVSDQGIGVNTLGSCWSNGNHAGNFPSAADTHGIAVDYRGTSPTFYLITADAPGGAGVLRVTHALTAIDTPLYIYAFGHQTFGVELHRLNVGGTPFAYDPRAALSAAGVPGADEVQLGWFVPAPRVGNTAPVLTAQGPAGAVSVGQPVTLSARAIDDLGDLTASIQWTEYDTGVTGAGASFSFTPAAAGEYRVLVTVRDAGGLVDAAIVTVTAGTQTDDDGDGLLTAQEAALGTDPQNPDTDGDGLGDGQEVDVVHTQPLAADTDGDRLADGWEVSHGYDPLSAADGAADPDGDHFSTGLEVTYGSDPADAASDLRAAVRLSATDHGVPMTISADGLTPLFGTMDQRSARSNHPVQPGSGLYYFEVRRNIAADFFGGGVGSASAPVSGPAGGSAQSFGANFTGVVWADGGGAGTFGLGGEDTLGFAVDYRGTTPTVHLIAAGAVAWTQALPAITGPLYVMMSGAYRNPGGVQAVLNAGGDLAGRPFRWDPRAIIAAAGIASGSDVFLGWTPALPDVAGNGPGDQDGDGLDDAAEALVGTNPLDADTDDDGVSDGDEVGAYATNPLAADTDGDGMGDGAEILDGLDPRLADATADPDADGASNAAELAAGTDPHDPASRPGAPSYARLSATDHHALAQISPDGLGINYLTMDQVGARSDVAIAPGSGFYYYEGTNLVGAGYHGFGVATAAAPLTQMGGWNTQSMGVSFQDQVYANGGWFENNYTPSTTVGLAIDYRAATPVVHVISGGALVVSVPLTAVTTPLHLYVWGAWIGQAGLQQRINTGASAFAYDAPAILAAAGVSTSGLLLGVAPSACATANGGCAANATCTVTGPGTRTCACPAGYSGDGLTCADVDECATANGGCAANAICTNTPGSRTCACGPGYVDQGGDCALELVILLDGPGPRPEGTRQVFAGTVSGVNGIPSTGFEYRVDAPVGAIGWTPLPVAPDGTFVLEWTPTDDAFATVEVRYDDGVSEARGVVGAGAFNVPPIVRQQALLPPRDEGMVDFSVDITDPGDDTWTVTVSYAGLGPLEVEVLGPTTARTIQWAHHIAPGMNAVSFDVCDDDGACEFASFTVVGRDIPPVARMTVEGEIAAGSPLTFTDASESLDGSPLTRGWSIDVDGVTTTSTRSSVTVTPSGGGYVRACLAVVDDDGGSVASGQVVCELIPQVPARGPIAGFVFADAPLEAFVPIEVTDTSVSVDGSPLMRSIYGVGFTLLAETDDTFTIVPDASGLVELCVDVVDGDGGFSNYCERSVVEPTQPIADFSVFRSFSHPQTSFTDTSGPGAARREWEVVANGVTYNSAAETITVPASQSSIDRACLALFDPMNGLISVRCAAGSAAYHVDISPSAPRALSEMTLSIAYPTPPGVPPPPLTVSWSGTAVLPNVAVVQPTLTVPTPSQLRWTAVCAFVHDGTSGSSTCIFIPLAAPRAPPIAISPLPMREREALTVTVPLLPGATPPSMNLVISSDLNGWTSGTWTSSTATAVVGHFVEVCARTYEGGETCSRGLAAPRLEHPRLTWSPLTPRPGDVVTVQDITPASGAPSSGWFSVQGGPRTPGPSATFVAGPGLQTVCLAREGATPAAHTELCATIPVIVDF